MYTLYNGSIQLKLKRSIRLHQLKRYDLLFNLSPSLIKLIIHSFSLKHNLHKSGFGLPYTFVIAVHLTEKLI